MALCQLRFGEGDLYGQGFFPGVVPGLFFNTVHQATLPLASPGIPVRVFKVGTVILKLAQIAGEGPALL
jgi:hypothetical protein